MLIQICSILISFTFSREVTVTADKITRNYSRSTSTIKVFERHEIENFNGGGLSDFLKKKSGLAFSSSGSLGQPTSLFLRGTESRHTLLIIDGVEYRNITNTSGDIDWGIIPLSNIDKIEILKGSQGSLYGSDAIGGVIKIETKKSGNDFQQLSAVIGSYEYSEMNYSGLYNIGNLVYRPAFLIKDTEGISSYNSKRTVDADKDGFKQKKLSNALTWKITKKDKVDLNFEFGISEREYDQFNSDDKTAESIIEDRRYGIKYEKILLNNIISNLQVNITDINRDENKVPYEGMIKVVKGDLMIPFEKITLLGQVTFENELLNKLESSTEVDIDKEEAGAFLGFNIDFSNFVFDTSIRFEEFKYYKNKTTYKMGVAYVMDRLDATIKGHISTGYKTPSLYQLYSPLYGNDKLLAESSVSKEISWLQNMYKGFLELSIFEIKYDDLISWNSRYYNEGESQVRGIEFSHEYYFFDLFTSRFSATYLRAENNKTSEELLKRPRWKISKTIGAFVTDKLELETNIEYVGRRKDFGNISLAGYTLVDLSTYYQFKPELKASLRLGNIFDKEYEEVFSYGMPGRNFKLSVNWSW